MARSRRRFGPLFYVTAAIALLVLISRPFWETANDAVHGMATDQAITRPDGIDPPARPPPG